MPARHHKAPYFLNARLFYGLGSFADLEARIVALPTEKDRGDAFEVFAEAYLATQKSAQAKEVWPDRAVPSRVLRALSLPAKDMGVDGVVETVTGEYDAYQVKFRSGQAFLYVRATSSLQA